MHTRIRHQYYFFFITLLLFLVKLLIWAITHSLAVLADALESIVNIIMSLIGWYSLYISHKPRDADHPYGHGKVELVAIATEGLVMLLTAVGLAYYALISWGESALRQESVGSYMLLFIGVLQFLIAIKMVQKGRAIRQPVLQANARHLMVDGYTSIIIGVGFAVIYYTGAYWLDVLLALLTSLWILVHAFKVLHKSVHDIMDASDDELLAEVIGYLQKHREDAWVDLHNLRILRYGNRFHMDAHLTLPWYWTVQRAHKELKCLDTLMKARYREQVELFIHTDGCKPSLCTICMLDGCPHREREKEQAVVWNRHNVVRDQHHS